MNCDDILAEQEHLEHYGILGMKWGVRRFETKNGHLTEAGKKRYEKGPSGIYEKIRTGTAKPAKSIAKKIKLTKEEARSRYSKMLDEKAVKREVKKELKQTSKSISRLKKAVGIGTAIAGIGTVTASSILTKKLTTAFPGMAVSAALANIVIAGAGQTLLGTAVNYAGNKKAESILANNNIKLSQIKIPKKLSLEEIEEIQKEEEKMKHSIDYTTNHLEHWGVLGMKWGVRRYQNKDGSLTSEGRARYKNLTDKKTVKQVFKEKGENITDADIKEAILRNPNAKDVKKYQHLFTAQEIQSMANQRNAIASMLNAEHRISFERIQTYKNFADILSTTVSAIKSTAYLAKSIGTGAEIVKSLKNKDYISALEYLSSLDGSGGGKKKKDKKKDDSDN